MRSYWHISYAVIWSFRNRERKFMLPYYQDDYCTIYNADCRDIIGSLAADCVITDPPYNVGLDYCNGDNRQDYSTWCQSWFSLIQTPMLLTPGMVNLSMWLKFCNPSWVCAWLKPNQCSPSALGGFNVWEPILVFGKFAKRIGHDAWVCSIGIQAEVGNSHPCPKWLPFWKTLVSSFTNPGDIILDPFMGSGTTLKAAKVLGRKAIGIEVERKYCDLAISRLSQCQLDFDTVSCQDTSETPYNKQMELTLPLPAAGSVSESG